MNRGGYFSSRFIIYSEKKNENNRKKSTFANKRWNVRCITICRRRLH